MISGMHQNKQMLWISPNFKYFVDLRNKDKVSQQIQQNISMFLRCSIILFNHTWFLMVLSLIHLNTCRFSKVIAWQLAKLMWSKATGLE